MRNAREGPQTKRQPVTTARRLAEPVDVDTHPHCLSGIELWDPSGRHPARIRSQVAGFGRAEAADLEVVVSRQDPRQQAAQHHQERAPVRQTLCMGQSVPSA